MYSLASGLIDNAAKPRLGLAATRTIARSGEE
jgi:hypothetical protein